ncbi:hypothetical protein D3C86_788110 [compost metagenome]
MHHVAARARVGTHVAGFLLGAQGGAGLGRREARVDGHRGLLIGVQDPVAVLLFQVAPRDVDVVAQRDQDVAQVLAVPGGRPGRNGALADRPRWVGHHRRLGHVVDVAQAVAIGAGALRRVGREVLGVQHGLVGRVGAGTRIQHAQHAGQGGDATHRGAHVGRAALLLQRHRRRQPFDGVDIRHAHLIDQASRIGRQRLQIAPLRFRVQRAERQRRFARSGHPRKHDERVSRNIHIDVLQIVFTRAANADASIGAGFGAGFGTGVGGGLSWAHRAIVKDTPCPDPDPGSPHPQVSRLARQIQVFAAQDLFRLVARGHRVVLCFVQLRGLHQ